MKFERVSDLRAYHIVHADIFSNSCVYPNSGNWRSLIDSPAARTRIDAIQNGLASRYLYVRGATGTAKTFSLLLFAHKWLNTDRTLQQRLNGVEYRAFYTRCNGSDVAEIAKQVSALEDLPRDPCIWIIDDIHEAPDTAERIFQIFENSELSSNHFFLFSGWGSCERLSAVGEIDEVYFQIDPPLIIDSIRAIGKIPPEMPVIERWASSGIGLRWLMHCIANLQEKFSGEPKSVIRDWCTWIKCNSGIAEEWRLLVTFSYASLYRLTLKFSNSDHRSSKRLLKLAKMGFIQESTPGSWRLSDRGIAVPIVISETRSTEQQLGFSAWRLQIFSETLNLFGQEGFYDSRENLTAFLFLSESLSFKRIENLVAPVGISVQKDSLVSYYNSSLFKDTLERMLRDPNVPQLDRIRMCILFARRDNPAKDKLILELINEICDLDAKTQLELKRPNPSAWISVMNGSLLCSNERAKNIMRAYLRKIPFHDLINACNPNQISSMYALRSQLLDSEGQDLEIAASAYAEFLTTRSAKSFWVNFTILLAEELAFVRKVIHFLTDALLFSVAAGCPQGAARALNKYEAFSAPDARLLKGRLFASFCSQRLSPMDTSKWGLEDIAGAIFLCKTLNSTKFILNEIFIIEIRRLIFSTQIPAIVKAVKELIKLSHPQRQRHSLEIGEFFRAPIKNALVESLENGVAPISERIFLLEITDPGSAGGFALQYVRELGFVRSDPLREAWFLWNCMLSVQLDHLTAMQERACTILSDWASWNSGSSDPFLKLHLAGLCAYLGDRVPPKVNIPSPEVVGEWKIDLGPVPLFLHLFSICSRDESTVDVSELFYLKRLIDYFKSPHQRFFVAAHELTSNARFHLIEILYAILDRIPLHGLDRDEILETLDGDRFNCIFFGFPFARLLLFQEYSAFGLSVGHVVRNASYLLDSRKLRSATPNQRFICFKAFRDAARGCEKVRRRLKLLEEDRGD